MIKKYKTSKNRIDIDEVEILRETEKCVFFRGWRGKEQRELKVSEWNIYHDSWDAAHAHVLALCERKVSAAESSLQRAKERLREARNMTANA